MGLWEYDFESCDVNYMYVCGVESYISLMQVGPYVSSCESYASWIIYLMQVCDDWIIYSCMNLMQVWVVKIYVRHVYAYASLCGINLYV